MGGFRSYRDAARLRIHDTFAVASLYRAEPESEWVPVSVRIHTRVSKFGDLPGLDASSFIDVTPKMIFPVATTGVPPRGALVSVSATEAWRTGEADPIDGDYVSVAVARVAASLLGTLPVPDDA